MVTKLSLENLVEPAKTSIYLANGSIHALAVSLLVLMEIGGKSLQLEVFLKWVFGTALVL